MNNTDDVRGLYLHWKGNYYCVTNVIQNTFDDTEMIIYHCIKNPGTSYCRPSINFFEKINEHTFRFRRVTNEEYEWLVSELW